MNGHSNDDAKEGGDVSALWWDLSDCLAEVSAWVRGQQQGGAWGFPVSDPVILKNIDQRLREELAGTPAQTRSGSSAPTGAQRIPVGQTNPTPSPPAAAPVVRPTEVGTKPASSRPNPAESASVLAEPKPAAQSNVSPPKAASLPPIPEPPAPISRVSDRAALPPPPPPPPLPKPDFQRAKPAATPPGPAAGGEAPGRQLGLGAWGNYLKPETPVESPDLTACADLAGVQHVLGDCRRCALHRTRSQLVFGQGPAVCRLLIVGEQPEMEGERQGKPLGGPGGQMVERILSNVLHIGLDAVYWTTAVKCRPPSERKAFPEESQACAGFLRAQVRVLAAPFMLVFGPRAHAALFPGADFGDANCTIRELRLDGYQGSALVLPSLQDLLDNQSQKKIAFAALKELAKAMGG